MLGERKPPSRPTSQPKVIRDSNPDFQINPDSYPDVCRIAPKCSGGFSAALAGPLGRSLSKYDETTPSLCKNSAKCVQQFLGRCVPKDRHMHRQTHGLQTQTVKLIWVYPIMHGVLTKCFSYWEGPKGVSAGWNYIHCYSLVIPTKANVRP